MGFFVNSKAIVFNIDGSLSSSPIDFGKTLGLSKQESTFALSFNWRFSKNKKWSFGFEYFSQNNELDFVCIALYFEKCGFFRHPQVYFAWADFGSNKLATGF